MPIPDAEDASGPDHLHGSHAGCVTEVQFCQEFREQRYESNPSVWSGNPNAHLISAGADLTPGKAPDVGRRTWPGRIGAFGGQVCDAPGGYAVGDEATVGAGLAPVGAEVHGGASRTAAPTFADCNPFSWISNVIG